MRFRSPIYPGAGVTVVAEFRDPVTGAYEDVVEPVVITVSPPAASDLAEPYLPPVTQTADGIYEASWVVDVEGTWNVRAASSGPLPGVDEGSFTVSPSEL